MFQDRLALIQDKTPWEPAPNANKYIKELLATKPELVEITSEDQEGNTVVEGHLEVTELTNALQGNEAATSPTLVVPPSTRGMWDEVVRSTCTGQSHQRILVVGSPGVGKSRSINHFIREIISAHRQKDWTHPMPVIVFEHRKDQTVWLFVPEEPESRATEYEALSVARSDFSAVKVAALRCPTNYYIVDSSQVEHGSSAPALLPAVTVFVCSPDPRHYSEWLKDLQRGFRVYCPSWSRAAVLAARPYMSELTEEVVCRRGETVGWIPRRVFAQPHDFAAFKLKIDTALRDHQADVEAVLRVGGEGIEAHNHDDKPRSAVFSYGILDGDYKAPTVHFVSDYARLRVGLNVLKMIFSSIQHNVDKRRVSELGETFERLVFVLLRNGWKTQLAPLRPGGKSLNIAVGSGDGAKVLPGGKGLWDRMSLEMKAMPLWDGSDEQPVASPVFAGNNFLLIDVADARNRGFNMTLGPTHELTVKKVEKLRNKLNLTDSQLLHIVFLVLPAHFSSFNVPGSDRLDSKVRLYKAEVPSPLSGEGEQLWRSALEEWRTVSL